MSELQAKISQYLCLMHLLRPGTQDLNADSSTSTPTHIDHSHEEDRCVDDSDDDSISSLDVVIEPQELQYRDPLENPVQIMLDALSFAASPSSKAEHVTAMMMEVIENGNGICFRFAMNGRIENDTVLNNLRALGSIAIRAANQGISEVVGLEDDLAILMLDVLMRNKDESMRAIIFGEKLRKHTAHSLEHLVHNTVSPMGRTAVGDNWPAFDPSLQLSELEVKKTGSYGRNTHHKHMENAKTDLMHLNSSLMRIRASYTMRALDTYYSSAKKIIKLSYQIRSSRCLQLFLKHEVGIYNANRIINRLRALSKYWQSCLNISRLSRSGLFQQLLKSSLVTFVAVDSIPAYLPSRPMEITRNTLPHLLADLDITVNQFKQTLQREGLSSYNKIEDNFRTNLQRKIRLHAEVILQTYHARHPDIFPHREIGCSKLACYCCHTFALCNPSVAPSRTHCKLYLGWGLPHAGPQPYTPGVARFQDIVIPTFANTIRDSLRRLILGPLSISRGNMRPDSTADLSETVIACRAEGAIRANHEVHFESNRLKKVSPFIQHLILNAQSSSYNESDGDGETYGSMPGDQGNFEPIEASAENGTAPMGNCQGCNKKTSRQCSKCLSKFFCSPNCEVSYEWSHVFHCCPRRPLDAADYLVKSCRENLIPDVNDVAGFGFERCKDMDESLKLLGLFQGLQQYHLLKPVSSRLLQEWNLEGTLAINIISEYERSGGSSGYLQWFKKNQHIVNPMAPTISVNSLEWSLDFNAVHIYLPDHLKQHVTSENSLTKWIADLKSRKNNTHECDVAILYGLLQRRFHPHPNMPHWYDFGYATCRFHKDSPYYEEKLSSAYINLFSRASFNEILKAYETGSLDELMEQKGLKTDLEDLHQDDIYLHTPPHSVYKLKQCIAINDIETPPVQPVAVDYGYIHCGDNVADIQLWMTVYEKLFHRLGHKDSELHKACIENRIFAYVRRLLPDVPVRFEKLCWNIYGQQ